MRCLKECYTGTMMKKTKDVPRSATEDTGEYHCLACGTTEHLGRRRYCSTECRMGLVRRLDILKSLLRALRTRYATFSFTESSLVLELLTCDSKKAYRFLYERQDGRKPAQDLRDMTDALGNIWWDNKRRTGKRYRASQHVLEKAIKNDIPSDSVIPLEINSPLQVGRFLKCLKLTHADLNSGSARETVKSAYRKEALRYHPDRGGTSGAFRKVNQAYQEVINWLKTPVLRKRRGLPGKWCFDGTRWITPLRVEEKTQNLKAGKSGVAI